MPFTEKDNLRYFHFNTIKVRHGIFTRHGGLSPEPWGTLNVGGTVGDEDTRVRANRNLSLKALERAPNSVFDAWQVHGADSVCAVAPRPDSEPTQKADIIFTDKSDLTLYMRFADCVPILMHDPRKNIIGIGHAGWVGTLRGVATAMVETAIKQYGSKPADLITGIGPSIGPDHYEVGTDVIEQAKQKFQNDTDQVLARQHNGKAHFDLWRANQFLLEKAGVENIEIAGICTACNTQDWFSHRAEKGKTGRFGALIALQ